MALSAKLVMRQGQTMVLTPQLLQAIKLLQMPNVELSAFIENELASNPLLERAEDHETPRGRTPRRAARGAGARTRRPSRATGRPTRSKPTAAALEADLGTEVENAFDPDSQRARVRRPPGRGPDDRRLVRRRRRGFGVGLRPPISRPMCPRASRCGITSSGRPASSSTIRAIG